MDAFKRILYVVHTELLPVNSKKVLYTQFSLPLPDPINLRKLHWTTRYFTILQGVSRIYIHSSNYHFHNTRIATNYLEPLYNVFERALGILPGRKVVLTYILTKVFQTNGLDKEVSQSNLPV